MIIFLRYAPFFFDRIHVITMYVIFDNYHYISWVDKLGINVDMLRFWGRWLGRPTFPNSALSRVFRGPRRVPPIFLGGGGRNALRTEQKNLVGYVLIKGIHDTIDSDDPKKWESRCFW